MGVQGLWQILEPAGRPVDVHSLKGKILAVDASIWLHQLVKGFRDKDGNPVPNAHLLGIFYRVCKLLSYGIKPVFVFDGGVPVLKRQTMEKRRGRKLEAIDKSEISRQKLLSNYIRQQLQRETRKVLPTTQQLDSHMASTSVSGGSPKKSSASSSPTKKVRDDVDLELQQFREKFAASTEMDVDRVNKTSYKVDKDEDSSSSEDERSRRYGMDYSENFSAITSKDFDVLPLETQHEVLFEMQESRKMNSWGKMDKMPNNLQDFSNYQMDRLVKRRFLQKKIQSVQQEMGQRHIHVQNLDELLKMNYNFDSDDIIGSQEKGFVLVKKSPQKKSTNDFSVSGGSSEVEKVQEKTELSISFSGEIDDSDISDAEGADERADIIAAIHASRTDTFNKSVPDLGEQEQIALAIKLSLEQEKTTSDLNPKPIPDVDIVELAEPQVNSTKENQILKNCELQRDVMFTPGSLNSPSYPLFVASATASCSKFLDVVGFSSQALTDSAQSPENSSDSDSTDDFEAVEDEHIDNNDEHVIKHQDLSTVATISIADVVSKVPNEEDDIFADIFNNSNKVETTQDSSSAASKDSNSHNENMEEEVKWDSDPDEKFVEELENQTITKAFPMRPAIELSKTDALIFSVIQKNRNQEISRTLGKMPQQSTSSGVTTMISAEYMQAQEKLNAEQTKLQAAKGFQERVATSISDQISVETQELLGLFGIPFIVSPMEAESQCAFLDAACLTDGTITDDSDVWLFGSLRVYKNFYSAGNKPIEFYQLADITTHLNLDREKLVLIAMLSGGDYSDGIEGVGPVTALEILAEFPNEISGLDTLVQFREWWDLVNESDMEMPELSKIREKLRKLKLRPGFPNDAVYQAYMNPSIDKSTEAFRWGNPDLQAIRDYAHKKFGWDTAKCDSMLSPIVKSLQCQMDKLKQPTLDSFVLSSRYSLDQPLKRKRGSKRLQTAFKKLKQHSVVDEVALSSESSSEEESPTKIVSVVKSNDANKNQEPPVVSVEQINANLHRNRSIDIPQKIQNETNQYLAKRKAIEIFKSNNKNK